MAAAELKFVDLGGRPGEAEAGRLQRGDEQLLAAARQREEVAAAVAVQQAEVRVLLDLQQQLARDLAALVGPDDRAGQSPAPRSAAFMTCEGRGAAAARARPTRARAERRPGCGGRGSGDEDREGVCAAGSFALSWRA
ncbi:hypothetical protein [Nannocystis pusilla]|uniref:hypothetical protein n=1 Tax=Nannocystis pusilla TaxID=889268 RepID=UPI003DA3EFA6